MRQKKSTTKTKSTSYVSTRSASPQPTKPTTGVIEQPPEIPDGSYISRCDCVSRTVHTMFDEVELLLNMSPHLPKDHVYAMIRRFNEIMNTQLATD